MQSYGLFLKPPNIFANFFEKKMFDFFKALNSNVITAENFFDFFRPIVYERVFA